MQNENDISKVEAVLFLAKEPLSSRKIAQMTEMADGTRVRSLIRELKKSYDERKCSFQVVEIAGGFQLRSRAAFAPWIGRLHVAAPEHKLSGAALETLSVIAFKQPVLRSEIESIRGVQCGDVMRQLLDMDLIRISGRSKELGRAFFYGTTVKFLQIFGLKDINEIKE